MQYPCGGGRKLAALIYQPPVTAKILSHLALATEALTKSEDPVRRVRGPPDELFPPDVDEAGLPVGLDAVDEDPSEPFFDELPAEDWAAQLRDREVGWPAEACADRADRLEQT